MKIAIALFVLMAVAWTSAESNYFVCGTTGIKCDRYWTCFIDGSPRCDQRCDDRVALTQTIKNSWVDAKTGQPMIQVDCTIKNVGLHTISNVIIDAAELDFIGTQVWSVDRLPNTDIILPSYQQSLVPGQIHNFGYIARGTTPAHLWVKHVIVQ